MSQVSTLPSTFALNHSSGPQTTMPPDSSTDPAELLRRAALSSRKLKRRKVDAAAPLSRPLSRHFASTPSISLDYGQGEPSSMASPPQQSPTPVLARAPTPPRALTPSSPPRPFQRDGSSGAATAARTPLDDDTSMREEGEISDNEDPPFRPPSKPVPPPITVMAAAYPDVKLEASGSVHSPSLGVVSRSPSVKTEDACQHAVSSAYVTTPVTRPSMEAHSVVSNPSEIFRLETPLYVLDHDHVRPGLSLTQRQYDAMKDVILDILGYGVPPEYLIDCGISKETIYYVFTELNLRLPSNFDTVGIHPYPPTQDVIASILLSQSTLPPSPPVTTAPNAGDIVIRPGSVGHSIHFPYPVTRHDSAPTTTSQAGATTSVNSSLSASVLALSESTLTTIERQRKQELLARKAVQATMKRKEPVSVFVTQASASSATSVGDTSAKSSASAVSVEDFFNSIELPPSDSGNSKGDPTVLKTPGPVEQFSPEPMSIDESIPGFGRNNFSEYDQPQPRSPVNMASVPMNSENKSPSWSASAPEQGSQDELEKELPTHKVSRAPENLPTRPRSNGISPPHLAKDNEGDSRRSSTTPQPTASIPRRGTKRPVAADFDSEPIPKAYTPPALSRTGSGAGFSNGAAYHPNPHVRRKMNGVAAGGFASLNSARRCVIDVSDSEDDASEDETSAANVPHETLSSARESALALELEIERMRKIIREREEMKLRKQAMASSRSTPVSRESAAVSRHEGETAALSGATGDEIPRSHNGNAKLSENVLATGSGAPSEPDSDVNSPISSTPSAPGSPLSPYQAQVAVHAASTDQSATPADGDQAIGGPALAAEPRQESAASSRASTPYFTGPVLSRHSPEIGSGPESVDVDASAQVSNRSQVMTKSSFSAYNSVLSHYPSLGGSLGLQEMSDTPNFESLKVLATARRMTDNGFENGQICQFEVPGGGECRDEACNDTHLSRLEVEPHDEEVARYLCGDRNVTQIVQALQAARTRRPEASFDERVKEAWQCTRGQWTQDKT